jgi:dipeptidyl aminopeptidase/acylaminoacyl peptidase
MNTSPKWSPDGKQLLFLVSFQPDADWSFRSQLHVLDVASGDRQAILGEEWGGIVSAVWARDGQRIVFAGAVAADAVSVFAQKYDLWTVKSKGGEPVCHTGSLETGVGSRVQADMPMWDLLSEVRICLSKAADAAYVISQTGVDIDICRVGLDSESIEPVLTDPGAHLLLDIDEADRLLYVFSTLEQTPDLFVCEGDWHATTRRITSLNSELMQQLALPEVHWLKATAPDGLVLDACVLTPREVVPPHPTVLCIHGGPYGAYGNVFMMDFHVLAGAGFAVVFSNFRGSGGYGTAFSEAIVGRWGPAGMPDHLAAVDRAVELGIADAARLGVYGLSHGGFATCWLVGHTNRFKAGIAENPVTNWATAYGVSDASSWVPLELGALPHEAPEKYAELSPLRYAPHCTTPLLFIVGESDLRCPACEAEQYYRVLKTNGCPTAMLRLPNSNHIGSWNGPPAARDAQNEALVEWFTRYLGSRKNES